MRVTPTYDPPRAAKDGVDLTPAVRRSAADRRQLRRRIALVGLITFVVALAAIDARATYGARISVDEPQYLLTAISLGEDFDLDISDEIREDRFLPFHERPTLSQQTIDLNDQGQRLSPHDPLLPLALAGPMRLGGWVAARIAMAAFAGLTAMATVWTAVRRFGLASGPASLVIGAFSLSPPLIAFGNQIYPAMLSALCVVGGVALVTSPRARVRAATAIPVVALPWLSVKYAPHAAVLAVAIAWTLRHHRRLAAATMAFLAAMGVAYLALHQGIYGGWTVYSTGDHFVEGGGEWEVVGSNFNPLGRTRRLVGLLVDKNFGLAAWAPAFLAAPLALTWFGATKQRHRLLLFSLVGVGWAMATWIALTMHGWWWPGRQVVPVVPLLVIAITTAVVGSRARIGAVLAASALAIAGWLWLVVEASTDRRTLIVDFFETSWPVYRAWRQVLPNMAGFELTETGLTVAWTIVLVAPCVALLWRAAASSSGTDARNHDADAGHTDGGGDPHRGPLSPAGDLIAEGPESGERSVEALR